MTDDGEELSWPEHPAGSPPTEDVPQGPPDRPRAPAWVERLVERQRTFDVDAFAEQDHGLFEVRAKGLALLLFGGLFALFVVVIVVFVLRVTGRA